MKKKMPCESVLPEETEAAHSAVKKVLELCVSNEISNEHIPLLKTLTKDQLAYICKQRGPKVSGKYNGVVSVTMFF